MKPFYLLGFFSPQYRRTKIYLGHSATGKKKKEKKASSQILTF
jgi:hypothetical protein